jgi:hypothetical protein
MDKMSVIGRVTIADPVRPGAVPQRPHVEPAPPQPPSDSLTLSGAPAQEAPLQPLVQEAASPARPSAPVPTAAPDTLLAANGEGMIAGLESAEKPLAQSGLRSPESCVVAEQCHAIAKSGLPLAERASRIAEILIPGVEAAAVPDPTYTKATPEQVRLFVTETLEHTDAMQGVGELRGMNFGIHDFEGDTSKFNPEIAQFLAKPGRDASVQWAIKEHNFADHHAFWADPKKTAEELKESASDIVNAWRMPRRVYQKESWSWERVAKTIDVDEQYGKLSAAQAQSLREAVPYQAEYERQHGLPA